MRSYLRFSAVAQTTLVLEQDVISRVLRKAAARYKKKRSRRLYALTKRALKGHERKIRALKLRLNASQVGLDR